MKRLFAQCCIFLMPIILPAQPALQWQRALGGTGGDDGFSIQQTLDGGYILAGFSTSFNGDVSGGHGGPDCWIVKMTSSGMVEWQKMYGGSSAELADVIRQTPDGGYIFAGKTLSEDGDVISGNAGDFDWWVVKLTPNGSIQWERTYGGSGEDEARSLDLTPDGGYIIAGHTTSTDGDVSSNDGGLDSWIVKLDSLGTLIWEKTYGGSNAEYAHSVVSTRDGGYIVAGQTWSNDGDVSGSNGNTDVWVIKLNESGLLQWQNAMGGIGIDIAESIIETLDDGYIFSGYSASGNSGDVSGHHGFFDFWVVKLNENGEIIWQKALGGSDEDLARAIVEIPDNSGYVIAGETTSMDGDAQNNTIPGYNWWVVKINLQGEIQWTKILGGSNVEALRDLQLTTDGGVIMTGHTYSNDGDVTGFHGGIDVWVVKLSADSVSSVFQPAVAAELAVSPNPAVERLWLDFPQGETSFEVRLTDALGRVLGQQTVSAGEWLDISRLPAGLYYLDALGARGQRYATRFGKE